MDERNNQMKLHLNLKTDIISHNSGINSVLLLFNFCPHPIDKTNVIKINIEMSDKHTLKDALLEGIQILNQKNEGFKIIEKMEKYKIRLSKKTGLPDLDVPKEEHLIILPKKKFDPQYDISNLNESFSSFTRALNIESNDSKNLQSEEKVIEKKGTNSCCCVFIKRLFCVKK